MGRKKSQAVKTRQLMQSARLTRYKQMLREAGENINMPKPSKEAMKQKEEELKRLYLELVSKKEKSQGEVEHGEHQEQEEPSETEGQTS